MSFAFLLGPEIHLSHSQTVMQALSAILRRQPFHRIWSAVIRARRTSAPWEIMCGRVDTTRAQPS